MNKQGTSRVKTFNFIIGGFGFVILWFGFICFAAMNVVATLAVPDGTYTNQLAAPTTLNITIFESRLAGGSTQLADVERLLEIPIVDRNLFSAYLAEKGVISSVPISRKLDDILKYSNDDVNEMIFGNTVTVSSER